ncbi:MAG: hypothetical protein ACD_49C00013G0004 [uncultured bacterium (gcode 4)]|uniref:Uncharacterized protein n=1 Tax=uncultured bacterium (gcode 4) TaxID=1234023 RepID=K2AYF0_9BACT|nr:MAG: hypothetical protein ACD_49C00013G0004 [uncultured bacterium (gcode 4)]
MIFWIIANKITSSYLIKKYELAKIENNEGIDLYKAWNKILAVVEDNSLSIDKSLLYIYTEFNPNFIFHISSGTWISNEHTIWDIILPNTFLQYDPRIENTEFRKENIDSFFKWALFIENYHLQKDYDFNKFWLSIGWICVSWKKELSDELVDKARIAYEADVYDKNSFSFVSEASKISILDKVYVIIMIWDEKSEWISTIVGNWIYVFDFILDNLSELEENLEVEI